MNVVSSDHMLRSAIPFCHNVLREQLENMPRHSNHRYDLKRLVDGYYLYRNVINRYQMMTTTIIQVKTF